MPKEIYNLPVAEDFMETARSFGNYDLALALADIVDNSITAGASEINIEASFERNEIRISDNGSGMNEETLVAAMRLGSKNPREQREPNDLGRFGLGLKTASFSQADKLTVLTNFEGKFCGAQWDLNNCADFRMAFFNEEETLALADTEIKTSSGTEVIWADLSRMKKGSAKLDLEDDFNNAVWLAVDELGMIFHRFLDEREPKSQKIQINVNGRRIEAKDPFCRSNQGTQSLKTISETINGETIKFSPFVLPYYSNLSAPEREQLGGKEGFVKNSGFYIYRQKRLIIRGTWFKLIPYGELSKLARIMVDVPNSLDEQWKITVDKSGAQLPPALRKRLSNWLDNVVVTRSKKVFKHKADNENKADLKPLWFLQRVRGKEHFEIDTSHPILKRFAEKLDKDKQKEFSEITKLIQHCLPIHNVHSHMSDNQDAFVQGYIDLPEPVLKMAKEIALSMKTKGDTDQEVRNYLTLIQPFSNFPDDVIRFLEKEQILRV